MLSALAALHSSASALSLTSSLSASSASSRAAVVRMDDIPMVKAPTAVKSADREPFSCSFEIPKKGISEYGTVNMNFKPILTESELVMVTYELPFGLAAEPRGRVVAVTKDGEGGEKEGDILRFTLEWQGGEAQPAMFDVCSCMERRLDTSFDEVVKALTSNDGMCTLPPSPPPAQLPRHLALSSARVSHRNPTLRLRRRQRDRDDLREATRGLQRELPPGRGCLSLISQQTAREYLIVSVYLLFFFYLRIWYSRSHALTPSLRLHHRDRRLLVHPILVHPVLDGAVAPRREARVGGEARSRVTDRRWPPVLRAERAITHCMIRRVGEAEVSRSRTHRTTTQSTP